MTTQDIGPWVVIFQEQVPSWTGPILRELRFCEEDFFPKKSSLAGADTAQEQLYDDAPTMKL